LAAALIVAGCSHNKEGDAIGAACTTHSDCSGLCLDPGGGVDPYCTDTCDASTMPCPTGFDCTDLANLGYVCVRANLGGLGDPCTDGAQCASGFCNNDLCSECEGNGDCPGAQTCVDDTAGVGYFVCLGDLAAICQSGTDCASGFCFNPPGPGSHYCSECETNTDCGSTTPTCTWDAVALYASCQ
jgi:hypothetical protein